jgi:uncharacterized UPF0146 family protein
MRKGCVIIFVFFIGIGMAEAQSDAFNQDRNANLTGIEVRDDMASSGFSARIDDIKAAELVKIYPIPAPADKYFNVVVPSEFFNGSIVISDVVGQQLKMVDIVHQEKVKVSTEGISSGVYFVSIDLNNDRVFTKRIVIDR